MMKRIIAIAVIAAVVLFFGPTAYAQNVHLKPPKGEPTFTDLGLTLNATGALAGLGGGDVTITLSAASDATAVCIYAAGATQPPGQNPAPVTVSGSQSIPEDEIKNGNVTFFVTTVAPVSPIAGAPGCPNPNWTEVITDLAFKSATILVEQGGGVVLTLNCTFIPSTSNGAVPAANVDCTSG
jgi:hypothetical protein